MRVVSEPRRRTRTHSTAARQVASSRDARQRRRAQRRREFAQQWQRIEQTLLGGRQWLPALNWQMLRIQLPGFSGFRASKLMSLLLLLAVFGAFYTLQEDESFFVYEENVRFVGSTYLTQDELYTYFDMESWSVLWIDPELIGEQLKAHPYVASAAVEVRWPAQVTVLVREVEPVALWSTAQGNYWLLQDGRALAVREDRSVPLHIVDPEFAARAPVSSGDLFIQPQLMQAASELTHRLHGLNSVRYNLSHGLNFAIPETQTWVYWGNGQRFEEKWAALQAVLPDILANRTASRTFSVVAPNRPFFRHYAQAPAN
jgi:cell division septal protein FtsQ